MMIPVITFRMMQVFPKIYPPFILADEEIVKFNSKRKKADPDYDDDWFKNRSRGSKRSKGSNRGSGGKEKKKPNETPKKGNYSYFQLRND